MKITEISGEADVERLLQIWEAAVRATHFFLEEAHIELYRRMLRESGFKDVELVVAKDAAGEVFGFMGLTPPGAAGEPEAKIEMLFVDPEYHGKGIGSLLVRHAEKLYGSLLVDVNEQNPGACRFYEHCGFVPIGRSECDGQGDPFPLLHLRKIRR